MLDPLAGTHLADGLQSLLEKIRSVVPKQALEYFAGLDETVYVRRTGTTDYAPHAETIRLLIDAARNEMSVDLTYRSFWRGKEYATLFDPYGLVYYDGDLFVPGRSHRAEAIRIFKVSRIRSAAATSHSFQRPPDFSVSDHFRSSFGIIPATGEPVEIVVRFTGTIAGLVEERIWHESQRLSWLAPDQTLFDEQPGESETLVASFRLADLVEFKRWVIGFGRNAEVLKPDWLRREMHDELTEAVRQYET
jgi:predicted DNA-binding transcriptional regulator YafY